MAWERRYILKQQALNSDSQTIQTLIPPSGIVSGFFVKLAYTNGATGGGGQDIADIVTKIEVVANGNRILFSLSGLELLKWCWKWNNDRLPQLRDARAGAVQTAMFPVLFGRRMADNDYWINLQDYQMVQVNVTYAPTISATQFATLTGVLDIIGVYWPTGVAAPARKGWLRTVQVKKFTTVAAGDDITILARDFPMAGIMVYAFQQGIAEGVPINYSELRLNGGAYIPVTGRWLDYQEDNELTLPFEAMEEMVTLLPDNVAFETRSGRIIGVNESPIVADTAAEATVPLQRIRAIAGSQITTSGILAAGAGLSGALDATARAVFWRSRGIGIGHAVFLPLSRNDDFSNVVNMPAYDDARLINTQGNAGADVRISTWEVVAA